ncbi:hypothetical protein MMC25_000047 [Agyrium rufum]|nr:hypothetical protein [Agyrium rufum]
MAGPIRQPIDLVSLSAYLEAHVPEIELPISAKQFGFGQSNPTYQLTTADGQKFVLRKKPPGQLLSKTAHQVEREYRIIHALENTDVPVPKTYALCEDTAVLGTAFYIMEFLDGRIFEDASFPNVSAEERTELWKQAIYTIAAFHRVSPSSVNLESFGKPSGFYSRQIKTLGTISSSQAQATDVDSKKPVGKIPHFDKMVMFFSDPRMQPQDRGTLVHGDYKIDNIVFHKTESRVIGILDWEMSTLGHPLSDLSNLLGPYTLANAPSPSTPNTSLEPCSSSALKTYEGRINPAFTSTSSTPGLPTRAQLLQWYSEAVAWNVTAEESAWGDAFGVFRNSVIMQGIAARWARRQASSEKAKEYGELMGPFGEVCWRLCEALIKRTKDRRKEGHSKL